jgi:hypothetical protein
MIRTDTAMYVLFNDMIRTVTAMFAGVLSVKRDPIYRQKRPDIEDLPAGNCSNYDTAMYLRMILTQIHTYTHIPQYIIELALTTYTVHRYIHAYTHIYLNIL